MRARNGRKVAPARRPATSRARPPQRRPSKAATAPDSAGRLAQARRDAEHQLSSLRAIEHVAQSLSSELNLEVLLRKVLLAAMDVLEAGAGSLLLHDPLTDQLRFEVIEGEGRSRLEGKRMNSSEGVAGWVFTHGEPLIVDDVSKDKRFYGEFDRSTGFQTHTLICAPLIITGKTIGVLELVNKCSGGRFGKEDGELLAVLASQSAVAIENARLYQHLWNERNRILAVEEEVRRELARDIHDGPAQLLSAMVMNVRFIKALIEDNALEMAKQELSSLEDLTTRALKQVRGLLFNQRPVILETQGLFAALETYVKRLQESQEMNIALEIACKPMRLPGKGDLTAFSIVQEAVGNVKKHAPAASVTIRLMRKNDYLTVSVVDDGPGFDVSTVRSTYDERGNFGLLNMSERAQQIGGKLSIESNPGKGTRVNLIIPTKTEARPLGRL